jgi:methionyl-tRNA synthetase
MAKTFYLTTPLYYVNARPHIGHAYTTVVADTLARAHRQRGEMVFLLTGTDEHGEKISQAAQGQGISPKEFADRNSDTFHSLWKLLNISYDKFIRTSDPAHQVIVQKVLEKLKDQLELGSYKFWYCVPCETSFGLREVEAAKAVCPQCQRPVSQVEEENYFLPLEKHRAWLKEHIQKNPDFIRPESRRNEVLGMLTNELPALCVTRPKERVPWGIPVPFSPNHTTYVWFDALLNYISALEWPDNEKFRHYWVESGGPLHLVGKDIIRHHCLYWPIILHALGMQPPKMVFAHGWWLVKGEKISKSKGNIVDPQHVVEAYGLDAVRFFLLRDVPFGDDGIFSEEALTKRINSDLANDLGNLVYRTLTMLEKHTAGKVPAGKPDAGLVDLAVQAEKGVWTGLSNLAPGDALKALWELITRANKLVEERAPWTLAKEGKRQELENFLYQLSDTVRAIALLLWPFLPGTAESTWKQLGFTSDLGAQRLPASLKDHIPAGQVTSKGQPLFPRLQ